MGVSYQRDFFIEMIEFIQQANVCQTAGTLVQPDIKQTILLLLMQCHYRNMAVQYKLPGMALMQYFFRQQMMFW